MIHMSKRITSVLILFIFFITNRSGIAQDNSTPYKILHINSYYPGLIWANEVTSGIYEYFGNVELVEIYTEFMDAKRNPGTDNEKYFLEYIKNKYGKKHIDLIITADNAALDLVVNNINDPLFKNVPVVYCGISNPEDYPLEELNLYGVIEVNTFVQSFDLIKRIYPDFKTMYVMIDKTKTGNILRKQIDNHMKKYPQYQVEYIDSVYLDNVSEIVSGINSKKSVIYYFGINLDGKGNPVNLYQILNKCINAAKVPLFSSYVVEMEGPAAGSFNTGYKHGVACAKIAEKRLKGLPIPNRIFYPPTESIIDYSKLKQYNLDPDLAPEESIIINKPESIIGKYRNVIIINLVFILILVIVIVVLSRSYRLQKKSKEMMEIARDKAFESDQLKISFLANVSHELRTPLNAICGFAELAKSGADSKELNEYLNLIYNNSDLLAELVNDLLDVSMIDSKAIKIVTGKVNLTEIFHNLKYQANTLLNTNNKSNINLEVDINNDYKFIEGDELRISQVMLNLINNAIKYTEKGSITIGYNHIANMPEIQKLFPTVISALIFFVKDTGIGIEEDKQNFIFDRFSRIDAKYVSHHGGLGLGLNIAKSVVELMNGEVFVISTKGVGSTFGFYLNI